MADPRQEIRRTPPIIIVGAARSGTSMTAGVVQLCGAFGGNTGGPSRWNAKGMFENRAIRDECIKNYLRSIGADPLGQKPLPDTKDVVFKQAYADKWREFHWKTMVAQGYRGGPWYVKQAKSCLVWPLIHAAFPDSKWVVVRREPADIVRSCLRTGFMRAYDKASGWLEWVSVHERKFEEMADAGISMSEVWPQRMIDGDFLQMQTVINWLGLTWDFEAAREFVDPGLWRRQTRPSKAARGRAT